MSNRVLSFNVLTLIINEKNIFTLLSFKHRHGL